MIEKWNNLFVCIGSRLIAGSSSSIAKEFGWTCLCICLVPGGQNIRSLTSSITSQTIRLYPAYESSKSSTLSMQLKRNIFNIESSMSKISFHFCESGVLQFKCDEMVNCRMFGRFSTKRAQLIILV